LLDGDAAAAVAAVLGGHALAAPAASQATSDPVEEPQEPAADRNDAIALLAALQRDSRLLDIVSEPLDAYSDEQVGAAARSVLTDVGKVLQRMFGVQPLTDADEGSELATPASVDPNRYRLLGNVRGEAPFQGSVVHQGWQATRCEIPTWSGNQESANVIAPIELEIT